MLLNLDIEAGAVLTALGYLVVVTSLFVSQRNRQNALEEKFNRLENVLEKKVDFLTDLSSSIHRLEAQNDIILRYFTKDTLNNDKNT